MYKKYINKKYLLIAASALMGLAALAALVGYQKACQEQEQTQERALQAKLEVQRKQAQRAQSSRAVKKLIKVDVQKPFDKRFPAHKYAKKVHNQVTPKKRVSRSMGSDNFVLGMNAGAGLESKAQKADAKNNQGANSLANSSLSNSSYSTPSYATDSRTSSNTYTPNSMVSTPSYSSPSSQSYAAPSYSSGSRSSQPRSSQPHGATPSSPRASAASSPAHSHTSLGAQESSEYTNRDTGTGTGQSKPASQPKEIKKDETPQETKKVEDKKPESKEADSRFNISAVKPKPAARPKRTKQAGEGDIPIPSALEDSQSGSSEQPDMPNPSNEFLQELEQELAANPSLTDKIKSGIISLVELLTTISVMKNGWDYIKQACGWLESTFGIGKWVSSLFNSEQQETVLSEVSSVPSAVVTNAEVSDLVSTETGVSEEVLTEAERRAPVGSEPQAALHPEPQVVNLEL